MHLHETPNPARNRKHRLLAVFFGFGACMCALTIVLLLFPGTRADWLWRLNPEAQRAFESIGGWALLLMGTVGTACTLAAVGLWRGARWGNTLAVVILVINLIGDTTNALVRHDYRALIGLPIGGAMIFYLVRSRRRPAETESA